MPVSEDEYDDFGERGHLHHHTHPAAGGGGGVTGAGVEHYSDRHHVTHHPQGHVMTKAELRKSNKPIMEKKRRARINQCLNELKTLILDAMKKDPARHSKLEKADILEMTVKHLQNVQRQQLAVAVATDPAVLHKFKTGFSECATEVSRYVGRLDGVEAGVKQRLVAHLNQCVNGLQQLTPFSFMASSSATIPATVIAPTATFPATPTPTIPTAAAPAVSSSAGPTVLPQVPFPAGDVNNNHTRLVSGIQLIPSRLPSGELALVVPTNNSPSNNNNNNINNNINTQPHQAFFPPAPAAPSATVTSGAIDRSRPSAFTAVTRSTSPTVQIRPLAAVSPASSSSEESSSSFHGSQSPPPGAFKLPLVVPRLEPRTEVKLELKTMAVPRRMSPPLDQTNASRQALDFSMKPPPPRKRPAAATYETQEHSKVPRFSFHVSAEPSAPRVPLQRSLRQPSASTAGSNDSMWRPW